MGRRSPYLTKTKAAKNRGNYKDTSGLTDTSQDIFYTTESNATRAKYDYTNKYKNYKDYFTSDIYDSRVFDTYSPKRKGSGESYTYDDYTTSGISYKERKKRPKDLIFSVSTSDNFYKPPEKYNNVSSFRDYDHSYSTGSRPRDKKRLRLDKDLGVSKYHDTDILDESEQYEDKSRKYRSPRSRYYQDLIHEEPEKEFDFDKYFEKASPKVRSSPKQRRPDKYDNEKYEKQNKWLSRIPNKRKDYQVYAYQDPKHHEEVFKSQNNPEDLSLSSEVEIKTHEYPVLAFRDTKFGNKESDMVYLPIMVLDKKSGKSRPEKITEEPTYQYKKDNFQIYAANMQEQRNIFQDFGGLRNIITSEEPTTKDRDYSQKQDFGFEATSGMKYAGSLLETIIDEAVDTDFGNEYLSNDTNAGQRTPFTTSKSPFIYQVDVDILPKEPTGSLKDKDKLSSHVKNTSVNDPLHDGYPVTKDYIKVSASEQKRKSTSSPSRGIDENKQSLVKDEKIIQEKSQSPSSIKLIDDQTISMSIAQSKSVPPVASIMKSPSHEQLLNKKFSPARESIATAAKQSSRASHTGPTDKADTKSKQTSTKLSVLNEETSQDLKRKSIKTGITQHQSVGRSSKVASSGIPENTVGLDTTHQPHRSDRKSMKPDTHNEQTVGRQSKVNTSPSPVANHQKSVVHSPSGQDRMSTVAHMANSPTSSSHNMRASQALNRKSAVGDRKSKVHTTPFTPSPISDHHKSASQNIRTSHAPSRKSAVAPRSSTAKFFRDDGKKSMKPSTLEPSQKAVHESEKKSLAQSSSHHNNHIVAGNTNKLSHKLEKDDSNEALRKFTKDVFAIDLGSQGKSPSLKSEQKKPSVSTEKFISEVGPTHEVGSKRQSRKNAVGQQPSNALRQSQNVLGNIEPTHELIGDNSVGMGKTPTVQEEKKKTGNLMRTTSKIFTTFSKIGKKKSTEKVKPPTATEDNKDSHFVRSIEPTVTQYKNEQNKTNTVTKSKSKPDTKAPKEKKSLTRLFSRSKSKLDNESGDDTKKKSKNKSRSFLGILKRSKSSEKMAAPPAEGETRAVEDSPPVGCECLAHYIQNTRVCAYFFLGTTLHEQVMNIIKILLGTIE